MKKYLLKSFALLAMLFSAMTMSAVSYCGETITSTDGTKTAVITCTQPEVGTYVMTVTSSEAYFYGLKIKDGTTTFNLDGTSVRAVNNTTNTEKLTCSWASPILTITLRCTDTPVMTSNLCLNFGGSEKEFDALKDQVFEWPTSCEETDKWADVDWVAGSDNKYKVLHECLTRVVSVQQPGWAEERGIYVSVSAGISDCSVNGAIDGAGMILYLSSFTAKETEVTINYAGGSCTFWVYYADGTEGGSVEDDESPVMTSATVESYTHNSAVIAVEAEDNIGVVKYHIVDANNGIDEMLTATAGKITLANLSSATTYNLTISAIDKVGNESTGRTVTAFTTDALLYCDFPTGHESNAAFGDVNGRILVSAIKVTPKKIRLLIKSAAEATKNIDLVYVAPVGAAAVTVGSDVAEGGSREVAVDIEYATAPATYGFMIQWSNPDWTGRWQASINNILPSQLCTEPVEVYDVNFALASNGSSAEATTGNAAAAIDNNIEGASRWESAQEDPQTWTLDLGQARIFNTLEIVWEGAYGKTFTVSVSDDKETWKPIWTVEGQELAGFPYTQTQKIDKTTGRYIQFHGTARGTGYGYSFYEFRVYLAGVSTFTSLEAKPATNLTKLGEGNAITLTAKDQNGKPMADVGEVIYTVTPADAGTITNNIYTPTKIGLASIVATIGEVSAPAFEVFAYDGENLALNKSATAGHLNEQAYLSNDNDMGTRWGSNGASHPDNDWWYVDLGNAYDIYAVAIMWETARPANYVLEASETAADDSWLPIKTITDVLPVISPKYEVYVDLTVHPCRYMRVRATSTVGGHDNLAYGISMFDVQVFGTESASLTKAVSASVNDATMGTATVTQEGIAVTEVATGSQVTFTATANEGHIFVNWSNGNTNPSFTTTVDAPMDLTANFRALGNIYCNTEMTVDGHTIYVTMKRSAPETYQLIVRSKENLTNFGGTNFYRSNNIHVIDLRDQGVLSEDKHILTATFTAETAPYMGTPLYVIFEGVGEITYSKLDNIEYDVECSEDVTVTGLAIDPASVSVMVGGSQTLKAIFTPAHAFGEELEWISSKDAIATVDANGLVTAIAEGEAVITATLVSNPAISATCNVTVTPFIANTFYGNGSDGGVDFAYSLTTNANGTITIVADVFTNNPGLATPSFSIDGEWKDMTKNADGTYTRTSEKTFSVGQEVACFLYAPYTGGAARIDFTYIVGSSNERPTITVESVTLDKTTCDLMPTETAQLVATVNPTYATNKSVTWTSSDNNIATVDDNGLVTAVAAGSATITATSAADNTKTATCTVNVMAELTDVTYHASTSVKKDAAAYLGINYSITRTSDRTLRYVIKVNNSEYVDLEFNVVVNDNWQGMTYDASTNTYTYTTITTYADGDVVSGFFRQIKYGVEGRWDFNYVVGSTSTTPRTMVAFNDEDVDLSHLNNGSVYDVILKRNFVMDGDWNTICLPFALTADQVKEVFGEGTQLTKLSSSALKSSTEVDIQFEKVTSIEAATPYLIKPEKNVNEGVFLENVTINTTPIILEAGITKMIPVLKTQAFTGENNTFFLGANEVLYKASTSGNIMAMRAYFQFSTLTPEQLRNVRARVVFNENTETSVDNITIDEAPIKVIQNGQLIIIRNGVKYNVQGQKL